MLTTILTSFSPTLVISLSVSLSTSGSLSLYAHVCLPLLTKISTFTPHPYLYIILLFISNKVNISDIKEAYSNKNA